MDFRVNWPWSAWPKYWSSFTVWSAFANPPNPIVAP